MTRSLDEDPPAGGKGQGKKGGSIVRDRRKTGCKEKKCKRTDDGHRGSKRRGVREEGIKWGRKRKKKRRGGAGAVQGRGKKVRKER